MKIYLVGFMGSGKTVYGERLAKQLKWHSYDLDQMVEEGAGSSIAELFRSQGESYFRKLEKEALKRTAELDNAVIATGGGAPTYEDNMQWMNENGETIYLKLLPDKLLKRLKKEQDKRPLIQGMKENDLQQVIHEKLKARTFYYLQAHRIIDPLDVQPKELSKLIKSQ